MSDVLTAQKMQDAALHYLQRYASTRANLATVLQRRVKRWELRTKEKAPAEATEWIARAVEKCAGLGLVNDDLYTEQKIAALRRQGRSRHYILQTLQQKGVPSDMAKRFLSDEGDGDEEAELTAAKRHVARKRLGMSDDPEIRQKDLAKLLRAGFSYAIAKRALQREE